MLLTPGSDIVALAKTYVGIKETSKNRGFLDADFEEKMRHYGWLPGEAWCATFCRMIWLQTYHGYSIYGELEDILSKSVIRTYQNAKDSKIIKVQQEPVVGGIVLWSTGNGKGHQGLVEQVVDPFFVHSIEGNTTRAGVREGDQVMQKKRRLQTTAKWNKDWHYLGTIVPPDYGLTTEHLVEGTA